jgi:hypothetical protein
VRHSNIYIHIQCLQTYNLNAFISLCIQISAHKVNQAETGNLMYNTWKIKFTLKSLVNHQLTGKTDSCYTDFLTKSLSEKKIHFRETKIHTCITQIRTDMTENQPKYVVLLKCYSVCLLHTLSHLHTQLSGFSQTGFCFT